MRIRKPALAVLALNLCTQAHAGAPVAVAAGAPAMMDGRCEQAEWQDAATVARNGALSIRMKVSSDYLYMCLSYPEGQFGTFEGYLTTEKQASPLNIHVSAKVGDRLRSGDSRPEFDWWQAEGWWGNPVRFNSAEPGEPRFLPSPQRELQFDLRHFGRTGWRIMFDVYTDRDENGAMRTVPLPAGAAVDDPSSWLVLKLPGKDG